MNQKMNNQKPWQVYKIVFRLMSPMHIGYRKMANINYTRYYVPAKTIWGALTNAIVKDSGKGNFKEVGDALKESLRISYFFITKNKTGKGPLIPKYTAQGLIFGKELSKADFEREFLDAYAATAIEAESFTAEEESLHEVEIICPATKSDNEQVYLSGYIFEKNSASDLPDWKSCLKQLQIGGERKYGFGRVEGNVTPVNNSEQVFGKYDFLSEIPALKIKEGSPIPAHSTIKDIEIFAGETEIFVTRETKESNEFGKEISEAKLCFTPGTVLSKNKDFMLKFTKNFVFEIEEAKQDEDP